MADTSIQVTPGVGAAVDFRTESTNNHFRQVVVLGDPDLNAGVAPVSATLGLSVNVTNASLTVDVSDTSFDANITNSSIAVTTDKVSSATVTSVAASVTAVDLLASNANRKGFILYNAGSEIVFIKFGSAASTTDFTIKLFHDQSYEHVNNLYTGLITAIWQNATGSVSVTEF